MEPFIGQIQAFGFNFAPRGWALCNGQLLPIAQNTALFSLLGTIYGGDGRTTFGLPDLRGRVPMSFGTGGGLTPKSIGQRGGSETNVLGIFNLPAHNHAIGAKALGDTDDPTGNVVAGDGTNAFGTSSDINADPTANTGGGQAVNNMQPYVVINYCIALTGLFPSRN
ncbi:phage tail protein [Muriicola sp. Z0-33]|uniref:phage tail protein n=1 Tax=Muriicola sp. Z0-33 TaxID=2816957 RepID=UPI002238628D|nr:tail fiber protein [Muriicola sp. Z0-33]MCW5517437.1 phage tail protein [Muriicola sp. Z0-33]